MKFEIRVIPQDKQRYNTVGDWQYDTTTDTLFVDVSQMYNASREFLLVIHELIEAFLCIKAGVTQEDVDKFDMGIGAELDEPGDDVRAPYYKQHGIASGIERLLSAFLFVDWIDYENQIEKMGEEYNPPPKTPETSRGLD